MAAGFCAALLFWAPWDTQAIALVCAGLMIVAFGLQDDRKDINYKWKFLGQILAVLILISGGVLIEKIPFLPISSHVPWVSYPLTFVFLLGSINAINLSDGLDGLAAGITFLILSIVTLLAYQSGQRMECYFSLALMGGVAGFLRFNTYPAKIFMGDAGSQFIGLMTASLIILVTQSRQSAYSPLLPLLMLGLPILDTLSVIVIRLFQGHSPFYADKNHIHHRLLSQGFWHYEAVAFIYLMQIFLVLIAYVFRFQSDWNIALFYLVFSSVLLGYFFYVQVAGFKIRPEENGNKFHRRNRMLRRFAWYYHHSALVLQSLLSIFFLFAWVTVEGFTPQETRLIYYISIGLFVAAVLFRGYPQIGSRIVGYVSAVAISYLMSLADVSKFSHWVVDGYLIFMVVCLALAIRMTRRLEFQLSTGDLLVLFLILVIPQLPADDFASISLGRVALRIAVLVYCFELLLNKAKLRYWVFNGSAIAGIALLGILT